MSPTTKATTQPPPTTQPTPQPTPEPTPATTPQPTPQPTPEPTPKPTPAEPWKQYSVRTSGHCTTPITSEQECFKAAKELGIIAFRRYLDFHFMVSPLGIIAQGNVYTSRVTAEYCHQDKIGGIKYGGPSGKACKPDGRCLCKEEAS